MKYQLLPDGGIYTIAELEERLQFKFLPHNLFEEEVRAQGANAEAEELGKRFIGQIQAAYIPLVSIRWVNAYVGYGLFAEEEIAEGSYVGEYTGVVRKNDRRYFESLNNYLYEYPVPDEIGRNHVIDATQGNLTRFINHSSIPNLKPVHVYHDGFYHLVFLAIQPIKKGDQLSYDYGETYWYIRQRAVDLRA